MNGKLFLFPVTIGAEEVTRSLPAANGELLDQCSVFVVEELRSARRFLRRAGYSRPIDETTFYLLNEHTAEAETAHYLDPIFNGQNVGLLSEAGLPCVADPGAMITRQAQRLGIEVVPLVGPSSLMLALMASGLNGQNFAFVGYLPVDRSERAHALRRLEERALREGQTQIFIEAPYRNNQMLEAICQTLRPATQVCVATDITMPTQSIRTMSVAQWARLRVEVNLHKRNTVFLVG